MLEAKIRQLRKNRNKERNTNFLRGQPSRKKLKFVRDEEFEKSQENEINIEEAAKDNMKRKLIENEDDSDQTPRKVKPNQTLILNFYTKLKPVDRVDDGRDETLGDKIVNIVRNESTFEPPSNEELFDPPAVNILNEDEKLCDPPRDEELCDPAGDPPYNEDVCDPPSVMIGDEDPKKLGDLLEETTKFRKTCKKGGSKGRHLESTELCADENGVMRVVKIYDLGMKKTTRKKKKIRKIQDDKLKKNEGLKKENSEEETCLKVKITEDRVRKLVNVDLLMFDTFNLEGNGAIAKPDLVQKKKLEKTAAESETKRKTVEPKRIPMKPKLKFNSPSKVTKKGRPSAKKNIKIANSKPIENSPKCNRKLNLLINYFENLDRKKTSGGAQHKQGTPGCTQHKQGSDETNPLFSSRNVMTNYKVVHKNSEDSGQNDLSRSNPIGQFGEIEMGRSQSGSSLQAGFLTQDTDPANSKSVM